MRRLGEQKLHGSLFLNWPMFVYALFLAATTYVNYAIWFAVPLPQAVRMVYMSDTLLEAPVAAAFIRTHSPPSAHVVVLGSEPEIYFLSHRHSGTGYIYVYPLMEPQRFAQKMQDEMIREIETDSPEFVVYADNFASWMRKPESSPEIFNWWASYRTNYTLVGLADSAAPGRPVQDVETLAHFGGRLSGFGFEIYQRKPGARNSSVAPTF
jgi:hypothetical protein